MPKAAFAMPVYARHAAGRLGKRAVPAALLPSGASILFTGFPDVPAVLSLSTGGSFLGAISRSPVYINHEPDFPGRDRYSSSVGIMQTLPENRLTVAHLWGCVRSIKLVIPVCPFCTERKEPDDA